tara:strand:+ start:99 stop:1037 length:939 start_codon:yes stop_codon:yes gene_type:complete
MKPVYSLIKNKTTIEPGLPFQFEESNEIVYGVEFSKLGEFIFRISEVLVKLKLLNYDFTCKVSIIIPSELKYRFHKDDQETTLKTMIDLLKEMKVYNKMHYTFFVYDKFQNDKTSTFKPLRAPINVWQTDTRWKGDGNFILVKQSRNKDWMPPADMTKILEEVKHLGYEIKFLHYGQKLKDQVNMLTNCKCMITERSGHIPLAAMIGTPFILCSAEPELFLDRNGEFGTQIFETDTLGMNPDTKHLENDEIINKRFNRYITIMDHADNTDIVKKFLKGNYPQLQKDYAKMNMKHLDQTAEDYKNDLRRISLS